ncbi:MAG: succinyldiaminopimelate transaminase [Burkholderiaceae bacterium]
MNPLLSRLQPYPFEQLRQLFADVAPNPDWRPISLGIGEPRHATPAFIQAALTDALSGLAHYPSTLGDLPLRQAFAAWLRRRYGLALDPATQMLPVNGSREALFAFAQTVVDPMRGLVPPEFGFTAGPPQGETRPTRGAGSHAQRTTMGAIVVCPNPFYQIYEGAALLAGAELHFAPSDATRNFAVDWASVPAAVWQRCQLLYVCTPGNPAGAVMGLEEWRMLFELSDRHGFVIASDECYSEIYFRDVPPLGSLQAAAQLGRSDFKNLVAFTSLSKRSNVPGLRSGFCAGDAALMAAFLRYRTYHGSAMGPAVQAASIAAWGDEAHVQENRQLYREKFAQVTPLLAQVMDVALPDAGFYLWARVPPGVCGGSDTAFARALLAQYNVTVLPGSYLARAQQGQNPGQGRIRMALVANSAECLEAAQRIVQFIQHNPVP